MNARSSLSLVVISMVLGSYGGGCGAKPPTTSSGLKIFVTSRVHDGDFVDDNRLSGQTAMERADDFCQTDPTKPANGTFKALLVDGVARDALTPIDWVLKPETDYFRPDNDVRIATTTPAAILPPYLEHSIHDNFGVSDPSIPTSTSLVWTGFSDNMSFAAGAQTCRGWTFRQNLDDAPQGVCYGTTGDQWWTNGGSACSLEARIYCVEQ
jgi:hypothetical protein